ncbi:hypothetical protein Ppa05_71110 [Planomonospora parontospora subsp. antibiotica]|nr:hypothetical protein Ppa05_71110 [Planomonospora parontospora subsp. antibiotica]
MTVVDGLQVQGHFHGAERWPGLQTGVPRNSEAWVAAESQTVSKIFDSCLQELSTRVAPACVAV